MTTLLEQSSEQPKEYSFCQKLVQESPTIDIQNSIFYVKNQLHNYLQRGSVKSIKLGEHFVLSLFLIT
jgi:hypothetical protein